MGSPQEFSPVSINIDSLFAKMGTSSAPNNQFEDYGDFYSSFSHIGTSSYDPNTNNQFEGYLCLGDLWNHQESTHPWMEEIQYMINQSPTQTPTPLPSLRPNDEPSSLRLTREDQLHSTESDMLLECAAAASPALSQGVPIASFTQSLPGLIPVAHKQKARKLSLDKRRTKMIRKEDLQKLFGKNRAEAAKSLDVSVPTLKRISRLCGIARWPFKKSKNRAMSAKVVDESLLGPTCSSYVVDDPVSYVVDDPVSMLPESEISSPPKQLITDTTTEKKEKPMIVKVQYRDDYVKFLIFSISKADLEEKISKRLKLKAGSFKMRYLDEEQDWISITCDADLQLCKRSVGMTRTVKMSVLPSPT